MITRRFILTGFVTTAAVATASQYVPAMIAEPQLYATVYGVGWDLEVIEHHIYEPMSVAHFGGTPAIDQFREVTAFVHAFPVEPSYEYSGRKIAGYAIDPMLSRTKPVAVKENGFTNITSFRQIWDWQNSLRPDVAREYGDWDCAWAKEQALAEQDYEANAARYIAEVTGRGTGNA